MPPEPSKTLERDKEAAQGKHKKKAPTTFEMPYAYNSLLMLILAKSIGLYRAHVTNLSRVDGVLVLAGEQAAE